MAVVVDLELQMALREQVAQAVAVRLPTAVWQARLTQAAVAVAVAEQVVAQAAAA